MFFLNYIIQILNLKLPFNHLIIKYMNYTKQQIMELIKQKEEEEINELIDFTKSNIFTPNEISQLMSEQLYNNGSLLEPAVGTGNLLIHLNFDNYESIDLCDINQEFLNECPNHLKITKFNNDFLKKNFSSSFKFSYVSILNVMELFLISKTANSNTFRKLLVVYWCLSLEDNIIFIVLLTFLEFITVSLKFLSSSSGGLSFIFFCCLSKILVLLSLRPILF